MRWMCNCPVNSCMLFLTTNNVKRSIYSIWQSELTWQKCISVTHISAASRVRAVLQITCYSMVSSLLQTVIPLTALSAYVPPHILDQRKTKFWKRQDAMEEARKTRLCGSSSCNRYQIMFNTLIVIHFSDLTRCFTFQTTAVIYSGLS